MHRSRQRWQFLLTIILIIIVAVLITALPQVNVVEAQQPTPPPYDPAAVPTPAQLPISGLGRTIYQQNCAPCHGSAGNSDGESSAGLPKPPPKFSDPATIWARSPAEYFHTIKFGRIQNLMPPWGQRLDDGQIWLAAYYAWSLHTDQTQVQQGATLYSQSCASCHGTTGAGDGAAAVSQLPSLRDTARMGLLTQADLSQAWQTAHTELGAAWNEEQRRQVLDYIRTFSYLPPWESAFRPGNGVVQGKIVQGSAGGGAVASLPVTLTAYINFEPAKTFTTTADADGVFEFTKLATDNGVVYLADTRYATLAYNSSLVQFDPITPTQTITLPVYETTNDGKGVHIGRANWLIDAEPGALRIGVILFFSNQLDRTYVGSAIPELPVPVTVKLRVPTGATDIQFEDGELGGRYQPVDETIYDTTPVLPGTGTRRLVYSYRLPFDNDRIQVDQDFLYPIGDFNLLITELPNLQADVEQLTAQGNQTVQGMNFRVWNGQNLAQSTLRVVLRGLPPAGSPDPRDLGGEATTTDAPVGAVATTPPLQPIVPLSVGAVLLVALAGVLYLPLRKQFTTDRIAALTREKDTLVQEIAALDDQHATGQLPTATWTVQRVQLKTTLLAVAQELAANQSVGK